MKQYYDLLGIPENSDQKTIKQAYKQKAKLFHPDNKETGNEEKFKQINEAFSVLSGKQRPAGPQFEEQPFNPFNMGFNFGGFDFGGFNVPGFGGQRRHERPPETDQEINVDLSLNIEEIKKGRGYSIKYKKSKRCNECSGVGGESKTNCSTCKGQGQVQKVHQHAMGYMAQVITCPTCNGKGAHVKNPCKHCNADGYVVYEETMNFQIKEMKE